jgi:hypothetical protein
VPVCLTAVGGGGGVGVGGAVADRGRRERDWGQGGSALLLEQKLVGTAVLSLMNQFFTTSFTI